MQDVRQQFVKYDHLRKCEGLIFKDRDLQNDFESIEWAMNRVVTESSSKQGSS